MIDKAIIISTYPGSPWFSECYDSLKEVALKYPIVTRLNTPEENWYEAGCFYEAKRLEITNFFIIHDTSIIKDTSFFDTAFKYDGSVSFGPNFFMCIGKFELDKLPDLNMPKTKVDAVHIESFIRANYYKRAGSIYTIDSNFTDSQIFEEKYGRKNMILENQYMKKYKGHWRIDQCTKK